MELEKAVLDWFISGERGISSEAMACALIDRKPDSKWSCFGNHPSDPADLNRCVKLLEQVPEARAHMHKVAKLSKVWARLVAAWDELEALLLEERGSGNARKCYDRMQEIIKG